MWGMHSFYEELGVEQTATTEEILSAYRFLAQKFHPDVNKGHEQEAKRRFIRVQEAFEILSNPERRLRYDREIVRPSHETLVAVSEPEQPPIYTAPYDNLDFKPKPWRLKRKQKYRNTLAAWFFTICVFAAVCIGYLTWATTQTHNSQTESSAAKHGP
jgi:curved DNA-binding protein CbpA